MDDTVVVFKKKLEFINSQLQEKEYNKVENSYRYLTDMKIHSFSEDTITELMKKQKCISEKYTKNKNMSIKDFWLEDLD